MPRPLTPGPLHMLFPLYEMCYLYPTLLILWPLAKRKPCPTPSQPRPLGQFSSFCYVHSKDPISLFIVLLLVCNNVIIHGTQLGPPLPARLTCQDDKGLCLLLSTELGTQWMPKSKREPNAYHMTCKVMMLLEFKQKRPLQRREAFSWFI